MKEIVGEKVNGMYSPSEMKKTRVLIADDDPDVLALFSVLLVGNDLDLETACDGKSALAAIKEAVSSGRPYDLLITDLMMPDISGIELLSLIREAKISLSVLAITGAGEDKFRRELADAGIVNVLYKPFEFSALRREVNRILHELQPVGSMIGL